MLLENNDPPCSRKLNAFKLKPLIPKKEITAKIAPENSNALNTYVKWRGFNTEEAIKYQPEIYNIVAIPVIRLMAPKKDSSKCPLATPPKKSAKI